MPVLDYEGSKDRPDREPLIMEVGKIYDAVFSTGRYEIEYERNIKCLKITPQSYRVKRADGTTRLIKQGFILELNEIA